MRKLVLITALLLPCTAHAQDYYGYYGGQYGFPGRHYPNYGSTWQPYGYNDQYYSDRYSGPSDDYMTPGDYYGQRQRRYRYRGGYNNPPWFGNGW